MPKKSNSIFLSSTPTRRRGRPRPASRRRVRICAPCSRRLCPPFPRPAERPRQPCRSWWPISITTTISAASPSRACSTARSRPAKRSALRSWAAHCSGRALPRCSRSTGSSGWRSGPPSWVTSSRSRESKGLPLATPSPMPRRPFPCPASGSMSRLSPCSSA